MTRKSMISATAALLAGVTFAAGAVSPAAAFNDPAKPKQEQQPQKADSRKYCINTLTTGSRIRKLQCQTRAEWLQDGTDPLELLKQQER